MTLRDVRRKQLVLAHQVRPDRYAIIQITKQGLDVPRPLKGKIVILDVRARRAATDRRAVLGTHRDIARPTSLRRSVGARAEFLQSTVVRWPAGRQCHLRPSSSDEVANTFARHFRELHGEALARREAECQHSCDESCIRDRKPKTWHLPSCRCTPAAGDYAPFVLECISAFNLCRSSGDFCVKQSLAAVWRKGGPRCPSVKNNPEPRPFRGSIGRKNVGSTAGRRSSRMCFYASAKGALGNVQCLIQPATNALAWAEF